MKYGYKEIRKVNEYDLYSLSIEEKWFTRADDIEYSKFLNYADCENITTDELVQMASLVWEYSDLDPEMSFTSVMFKLAKLCYSYFEEI